MIAAERRRACGTAPPRPGYATSAGRIAKMEDEREARECEAMELRRNGERPSGQGPGDWFTGSVLVEPLFSAPAPARAACARVTFEPGARTAWHTHPLGQTLLIVAGRGWVQSAGGPRQELLPGDVAWFGPGERHWHGAAAGEAMTHIAIHEALDGSSAHWMEHVSDAEYLGG